MLRLQSSVARGAADVDGILFVHAMFTACFVVLLLLF